MTNSIAAVWPESGPMTQNCIESTPSGAAVTSDAVVHDFSTIAETHRPQIFRFLLASLRDVDLAETLTQECFLRAHRKWSTFRGDASPMSWLMRIAINLQKDYWRNRRMQFWRRASVNSIDLLVAGNHLASKERSPEQRAATLERLGQVWKAVENLSERRRTIFLLRFVEELEFGEIARVTGLPESTVKSHVFRALEKVRTELGATR